NAGHLSWHDPRQRRIHPVSGCRGFRYQVASQRTYHRRGRMMKRTPMIGSILAAFSASAFAQAPPLSAAAQCRLDATNYQNKKFADLRAAGQRLTSDIVRPVAAEARQIARDCADK